LPEPASGDAGSRILGVDPGSLATGWGLVAGPVAAPRRLDSGLIRLGRPADDLARRLDRLLRELEQVVLRCRPTVAAVEAPYHGVNARAALQLAHARGVVLAVLAGAGVQVVEYAPAMVKKSVTGNGRAPKPQVRAMVERLLGAQADGHRESDPWDALAVALCHSACRRHHALTARATRAAGGA
jgi:crossover junction endodeoxyribonuclease RuvC